MARAATLPVFKTESGLSHYLDEIRRFPMLEPQEEYMLAKRLAEHGREKSAEIVRLEFAVEHAVYHHAGVLQQLLLDHLPVFTVQPERLTVEPLDPVFSIAVKVEFAATTVPVLVIVAGEPSPVVRPAWNRRGSGARGDLGGRFVLGASAEKSALCASLLRQVDVEAVLDDRRGSHHEDDEEHQQDVDERRHVHVRRDVGLGDGDDAVSAVMLVMVSHQ